MSCVRLAKLSYAQLLEIVVDACESSPELKNKVDALIAEVAPLPSCWAETSRRVRCFSYSM